eukprot:Phypoly_transcript_08714.p2 GENE.Phypoly_transcript_08714~~Phypoly_transcript_08714.p2  ORF type:complete len:124 (+),score=39.93 Phypoly_transcript_08714:1043-1414(+)
MNGVMTNERVLRAVDGASQATKDAAQSAYEAAQLAAQKTNRAAQVAHLHAQIAAQYAAGVAQGAAQYTGQVMKDTALSAQHAVSASVNATLGMSRKAVSAVKGAVEKNQESAVSGGNAPAVGA